MSASRAPVIVVAPDSFKGSLSAREAAEAMAAGVFRACPRAEIRQCPMADGGEGTLDAVLSRGGSRMVRSIRDACGTPRPTLLGVLPTGEGVLEVAQIVGMTDEVAMRTPVLQRTTAGVGEGILELLNDGCASIYVALGGSSTNDGGFGMLSALGVRFLDQDQVAIPPTPAKLPHICTVDLARLDPRLGETRLIAMSDVENPLSGPEGATIVFGPQKGLLPDEALEIDAAIARVAALVEAALERRVACASGAGAAGGLGFAVQVLGGVSYSGAATVARLLGFERSLNDACLVITGEGRSDAQTLRGKAPLWIAKQAAQRKIPAVLISGAIDPSALAQLNQHFAACFSTAPGPIALEDAIANAYTLLANQSEQVVQILLRD